MWWLPQISGYSYPRVTAIRIDVHPTGENLTNTTRTFPIPVHICPAYTSCGRSPSVATIHELSTELSRATAPKKRGSRHNPQHTGWPTCRSVPSFSPKPTNEAVRAKSIIYRQQATRLTELIWPACDRYVQYLLTGANPLVLNRHRRELQPWRCWLVTYHFSTFPTSCLPFPPKGPARSPI
jgi:hypothetical protein